MITLLPIEHWALYVSFFAFGIFTGYKLKKPLQVISTLGFKEPTKLVLVIRDDLKVGKGEFFLFFYTGEGINLKK